MKKSKKIVAIALSIALVAGISVGATLALLTAKAGASNTFQVQANLIEDPPGEPKQPGLALKEHAVKKDDKGNYIQDTTKQDLSNEGQSYNEVVAGSNVFKDPMVYVYNVTAEAYVFVKVENNTSVTYTENTEEKTDSIFLTSGVYGAVDTTKWTKLDDVDGVYVYNQTVKPVAAANTPVMNNVPVFNMNGEAPNQYSLVANAFDAAHFKDANNLKIDFTVYACQSAGTTNAKDAWTKAGFN